MIFSKNWGIIPVRVFFNQKKVRFMMKKKLLAIGAAAVLAVTVASADTFMPDASANLGLTLTSLIGGVDVYCNGRKGPAVITSQPSFFPWIGIRFMFGSSDLQCQFYPTGQTPSSSVEIGSAHLDTNSGSITNIQTYNGHSAPTPTQVPNGISVTLVH
ncbi:MAG: hypothetical protein A3F13_01525 [Gammaproteobacteria bacterium RIFCSPHIGHO2_12_FULL_40_19]|nr:MAG: hypothetical protein A3F13_01525 [Gammaproteobacteria bacterium RIFCSPHIGHO2_12_FULL_40_19]